MNILEIGIDHGARKKLTELVKKKLEKGLSVEEIADILEESVDTIREIVEELQNK